MSVLLGELSANVRADTRRFNLDLGDAENRGNRFASNISNQTQNLSGRFSSLGQSVSSSFSRIGESMQATGAKIQGLGASLTKNLTIPLAAAATAIFKFGKDFESELSKVVGLVGISQSQVNDWGKEILDLAPKLGKAPRELADALFYVTSAGIRGAESMEVLTMAGKASAAGLGETKTIADLVTSAMNAYGKENLSAAQATDVVTMAVREGKAEASELASSMGQVLPLASELGVTFDQVAATQASMTKTGTDAAEAATQLKSIMAGLIKPSKQAEEQLDAMGTSSSEMRKKIREDGLLSALMDLKDMTNEYGEEAMARVFPNIRALMGVLDLMGGSLEANKVTFDKVTDAAGTLDEAFKDATETLDFKWNQAISRVQSTAIGFFDTLKIFAIPLLEKFSDVLSFVSNKFSSLSTVMKKVVFILGAVAGLVGPVISGVGLAITVLGASLSAIGGVISTVSAVIGALNLPILGIVAGIGALIAIIATIISKFVSFKDVINIAKNAFSGFMEVIPKIASFLSSIFSPALDTIKKNLANINLKPIIDAFNNFKTTLESLFPFLKLLAEILGFVVVTAIGVVIGAINGLINAFSPLIAMILNLVDIVASSFGIIVGIFTGDGELIKKSFKNLWEALIGFVENLGRTVVYLIKGLITGIVNVFKGLYNTLVGHSIIPDLINGIINWFKKLPGAIISLISNLISGAVSRFNQFKSSVVSIISGLISGAVSKFNQFKSSIVSVVSNLVSGSVSKFQSITSKFIDIATTVKNRVVQAFNSLKSRITGTLGGINLYNSGKKIIKSLINGIKSMIGRVGETMSSITAKIRNYLPFSPAKEGALKDLDKIDFYSSINKALQNAKNKLEVPSVQLGEGLMKNISKSVIFDGKKMAGDSKSLSFNGPMNFYGIQDTYQLMKELRSTILRYSGRLI